MDFYHNFDHFRSVPASGHVTFARQKNHKVPHFQRQKNCFFCTLSIKSAIALLIIRFQRFQFRNISVTDQLFPFDQHLQIGEIRMGLNFAVAGVTGNIVLNKKKEFILSKQVLRSGTSIGANLEESLGAQSPSDFQAKISIAYKEALETSYWLRLLRASKYITDKQFDSIHADCGELIRILGATQLTMRKKLDRGTKV